MTTTTPATTDANSEQISYWNDVGGPKWVRYQAMLDRQLGAIGNLAMDSAGIEAGDSILDVGCGCGTTSLDLAARTGPTGRVSGIDISRPMLTLARQRANVDGIRNVAFEEADAQTFPFRPEFNVLFSRFGVMFFDDPARAFANLHGAMKQYGRLSFVCWQALHRNPWIAVPMMAAMKHVTLETPASPEAPGPFAFADAARVEGILASGGFRDIRVHGQDVELAVGGGGDAEQTVEFLLDMGPLARMLGNAAPELRSLVAREVVDSLGTYETPDGVKMAGAIWIVTARA